MKPGTIVAENVSRRFRVYPQRHVTLKEAIVRRLDSIVEFSELERFIDLPVRTYSAGMYMRLGFSIAVNVDAEVLLLDEVFAVGDEAFQRKCVERILEFKRQGTTIAFVSHSGAALERMCDRGFLLRQGLVEYEGDTSEAIRRYQELLAGEEEPAERAAGLQEWGTGEARVTDVRLEDASGEVREDFMPGDHVVLRLRGQKREAVDPPRLAIELRDVTGALLSRAEQDLGELGWDREGRDADVRFDIRRLPLVEGRLQLHLSLPPGAPNRP